MAGAPAGNRTPATVVPIRSSSASAALSALRTPAVGVFVLCLLGSACTNTVASTDPADEAGATTTVAPSSTVTVPIPDESTVVEAGVGFDNCRLAGVESLGQIERADLTETSGLAASVTHQDTVWAVNDSGHAAGLHAMTTSGADLGFFSLVNLAGIPVSTIDVEDLASRGTTIYVADIGDNNAVRDHVTIYVVEEPTPGTNGTATVRQQINVTYPAGPVDAEAALIDPNSGELVILDKNLEDTETRILTVDLPIGAPTATDSPPSELQAVNAGGFDLTDFPTTETELIPAAMLFPGAVTAADITTDGSLIAIRTYGTVWLFPRAADQSVAEALAGTPCETGTAREGQGESLTFLTGDAGTGEPLRFLSVSEGEFRPLNIATVEAG